jgi:BlaI family penicillinase repressor
VLNVVWNKNRPVTIAEVCDALPQHLGWHPKTVGTFFTRLADKGVLDVSKQGKANLYTPRISRENCVARESENFLRRVFRGATKPLLAHFAERAEDLTEEDIAELKCLLEQRESQSSQQGRTQG